jgi:hypothetical protein
MKKVQFIASLFLSLLVGRVSAEVATISIPIQQVRTHSGERGQFYVINVTIPEDVLGKRLDSVMMEFATSATLLSLEDSLATPVVGVFPLTQAYSETRSATGGVVAPAFNEIVPSSRPISLGEHRVLRMDITEIARQWLDEPVNNFGLVIGSLTGPRVGLVTLDDMLPGSDFAVRITFFFQDSVRAASSVK